KLHQDHTHKIIGKPHDNYLNLCRIDQIRIIVPSSERTKLGDKHKIQLIGYNKDADGQWSEGTCEIFVYPRHTYKLRLNHVTDAIIFKVDNLSGHLILRIDGIDYQS